MDMEFFTNVMGSSLVKGKRSRRFRPWGEEQQVHWSCSESTYEDEHESEDEEMAAHSLILLSHGASSAVDHLPTSSKRVIKKVKEFHFADSPYHGEKKTSYKCKTCSKEFLSFQALGGHRASCSHNTTTTAESEHANEKSSGNNNKMRVHECPICFRVFSSGQALGGHKRTHSIPPPPPPPPISSAAIEAEYEQRAELDLNMPAPLDDFYTQSEDSSAKPFSTVVSPHCKMSPPFWWMTSSGKRYPLVYNGGAADEANNKVLLGKDLGLNQDLFMVATAN